MTHVVTVKTINGLHYLYSRDVSMKQAFTPDKYQLALATAARLNGSQNPPQFKRVA